MLIKKSTKCVYFVSDFFISCCSPLQRSSPSFASTNFPNDQLWILFFVFSFVFKDLIKSSSIIVPLLQLPAGLERVPLERTGFVSKVWKIHGDADAWHWTQRTLQSSCRALPHQLYLLWTWIHDHKEKFISCADFPLIWRKSEFFF